MSELVKRSVELDSTLWQNEVLAQKYETVFIELWDNLRQSSNKYSVLQRFKFEKILFGGVSERQQHDWRVRVTTFSAPSEKKHTAFGVKEWVEFLDSVKNRGLEIVQTEWHHKKFIPALNDEPARSVFSTEIHLRHKNKSHRFALKGRFSVTWREQRDRTKNPEPGVITVTDLKIIEHTGNPVFKRVAKIKLEPQFPGESVFASPLAVYDLNGDLLPEIIAGGSNLVLWNQGDFTFGNEKLFGAPVVMDKAGIIADFTGDGNADYLGVSSMSEGLLLVGDAGGRFPEEPKRTWQYRAEIPSAITAGDIDSDGDLDVWFTQYKPPYKGGQMPTPYYDAKDGYPSFLFLNDGNGQFRDNTKNAGLEKNRNRRTYSSSFVDIDDDADLDLIVVSDFAGLDIYENDGSGYFADVTDRWVDVPYAFGMSHTFGDFDCDGRSDLYMVGMNSTTARRLGQLGLENPDFPDYNEKREAMTFGNRLYLSRDDRLVQTDLNDNVAQSGWAWGCSAFDFDNDADDDIYVANGHISGESSKDYCTRYWTHDLYIGDSEERPEIAQFLSDEFRPLELRGLFQGKISWNGFEHNKLYMNDKGRDFLEIGFLMDVGNEFDSRGVLTADLDMDGRQDLIVIENKRIVTNRGPVLREIIHVYKNQLKNEHHWIGVQLYQRATRNTPIGAKISISGTFGKREKQIITGDSHYTQRPPTVHFGLGKTDKVDVIAVSWADGQELKIKNPEIDKYHLIQPGVLSVKD